MEIQARISGDAVNQFFIDLHNQIPAAEQHASEAAAHMLYQTAAGQLASQGMPLVVVGKRLKKNTQAHIGGVWLGLSPVSSEHLNPHEVGTGAMLANQFIDGAFTVEKSGKVKLYKRAGRPRYPINPVNAYIANIDIDTNAAADTYTETFMTELNKHA